LQDESPFKNNVYNFCRHDTSYQLFDVINLTNKQLIFGNFFDFAFFEVYPLKNEQPSNKDSKTLSSTL
jgi:hypothetical protein